MPRNAAKKTNKNAKRLPVLIKLKNNNNNKRKKVHTNTNNNKSKNNYSGFQETKQKKKRRNIQATKAFVNATLTNLNKIEDNCDANITIPIPTTLYPIEKTTTTTKTTTKNIKKIAKEQEQDKIFKDFRILIQPVTRIKFDELYESELKKEEKFNFENNLKNDNVVLKICNFKQSVSCKNNKLQTNLTVTSLLETETETETVSQSLLPPISLPSSTSPTSSISSLYPIVIETSESFKQDTKYKKEHQQQRIENDTNSKKKKLHSINNCNSSNISTCCHTAAAAPADDTLEQRKKSQKNISCNNNKYNTTTKRYNNNNNSKQKQSIATTATTTATKVLTLSKPQPLSDQSQEVKARLATLRIRKKALQQQQKQQEEQTDKTEQIIQKTNCSVAPASKSITEKDIIKTTEIRETTNTTNQPGKYFIKKASPVLDNATLNLIETLSDEVKKPNNKRRRNNTTAILLGLGTLHQPRPKRIAANPSLQLDKLSVGLTVVTGVTNAALVERNDQKQTAVNFLKPLPIESSNTNSKKRARIMSLYERPFQTANDGRGSVVSNGYMTSSRSSASSGGATGALVMNETCDTQDITNQYYLSGTSGTGIAANSNQSLVGNGSAINHAPTMGTLCNIGNTCYLNSVVYTLRFAPQFLHNLHHLLMDLNALQQNIARARAKSSSLGRGITAVHMENARSWSNKDLVSMEQYASGITSNPAAVSATNSTQALTQVTQKSCHQLLTEKLHELYQSLHRNEISESTEPHHADTLLHAIQDVSSIFEGNQQQDAHEFLMCLLNSIRETSQTLIKAIAECPDVILNGYISNPDEVERDLIKNHTAGVSGVVGVGASNSNSLASASSKTSLFFSRKSKRKDESKNSKNSRLQSPLKDGLMSSLSSSLSANTQTTTTANSLFYLNTNDLNTTATSPACATSSVAGVATANSSLTSPSNLSASQVAMATDETDTPTAVALILKDKQRLEGKIKELGLDFFNEDFEGITVSTTKCLSCETITEQKETMIDIAVPVPQAGYESNELMDRPSSFIQNSCITREYFRNGNKYRCEQCCGYTEAIRSISYEVLPRLLIIQLSRFSGGMEKINSYIPTSFTLQCFCSKCCELSDANKLHIYKLYSVITHVGATMSVGHYIAYTCSLEWANEYINCPKEQRRRASQERNVGAAGNGGSGTTAGGNNSQTSTATAGLSTSSTGFMKMKMKFGRSKASSSGDMSKNVKQLNGLNAGSKAITNGIGKLSMNNSGGGGSATPQCPITCQSIHCCAMRLTAQQQLQYQSANNSTSDFSEESSSQYSNGSGYNNNTANFNNNVQLPFSTSANTSGYGSTGRGSTKASYATIQNNCSEPIWYMCDDDKIKAMTQREFEELLSPARKITITPYLLFYARYNLQSTPPKSATASTSSSSGPVTSSPQTSWSNESLQSSGHSAHSSGIRM